MNPPEWGVSLLADWLESFARYARFKRWNAAQQLDAFMMYLGGHVKRFCQQQSDDVKHDLAQLQEALADSFTTADQAFLQRQELNTHRQAAHESLERYIEDISGQGQRLRLHHPQITRHLSRPQIIT